MLLPFCFEKSNSFWAFTKAELSQKISSGLTKQQSEQANYGDWRRWGTVNHIQIRKQ